MDAEQIADIVKYRGLGFSEYEIAVMIGVSQSAVAYQLGRLKKRAIEVGPDKVYEQVMLKGSDANVVFRKLLNKLSEELK